MALKRNLKVFIKEKSTITALFFVLSFLLSFLLTLIPQLSYKTGISDTFKNYEITYMSSNNYSVVYAASDKYLFYSQSKKQASSLNNFAHIEDYSNEYGSATSNYYNFIKIDYRFSDTIIDVQGISDNMLGQGGETFILTKNNYLYSISERSKMVDLISRDIKQISIKRDYSNQKNIYLLLDTNNILYKCYFESHVFYKEKILNKDIDQFYYIESKEDVDSYLIVSDNKLFILKVNGKEKTYTEENGINYVNKVCDLTNYSSLTDLDIKADKLINLDDAFYVLKDKKVYSLQTDNQYSLTQINCSEDVIDIYTTGENAIIAKAQENIYYYGDLKFFESNNEFELLNAKGIVQGSRNALFVLDEKGRIKMYDKESKQFEVMYKRVILNNIFKYTSLFAIVMVIIYLFVSFAELNERYNRYFSVNNK